MHCNGPGPGAGWTNVMGPPERNDLDAFTLLAPRNSHGEYDILGISSGPPQYITDRAEEVYQQERIKAVKFQFTKACSCSPSLDGGKSIS
jgi:hypothetical protein